MRRLIVRVVAICAGLLMFGASAEETILAYHSDIAIAADATMTVRETITVRAERDKIRRGVYRDFPTTYRDPLGQRYVTGFDFISAQRDGRTEPWRSESLSNGVRIYLGNENVLLKPGEYTYVLEYRTSRQLGFFDDHDELFWNVTGNGWAFPIASASASIHLPTPVAQNSLKAYGYTGAQGSTAANLDSSVTADGASYRSTVELKPGEGLSVVLEFPKGIVAKPTSEQKLKWLLADNLQLLIGTAGLILIWIYYVLTWRRYGRDPARGVVIPIYEPPQGFSPASLRYIRRMGYDASCFAAAVLGLAAKGALSIREENGVTTLKQTGKHVDFAAGEAALMTKLFAGGDSITLKRSSSTARRMNSAKSAHKAALAADYEKKYFFTHGRKLIPGLIMSIGVLLAAAIAVPGDAKFVVLFMCVWLSLWSFGVYALVSSAISAWSAGRGLISKMGALMLWAFAMPFILGEIAGIVALAMAAGVGLLVIFVAVIGTNIAFMHWMKAPTQDGAKLLDRIEGFRWYLGVAEKQELDSRYRPEDHPEQFSALLPYAFALDVEQAWAKRFADALPADQLAEVQPAWYHGSSAMGAAGLASFTSGLTSGLSNSISSASTAPGSTSSGGSSGSSGGGGGGGGGGGW
ncbi:MAG TPA: DUF2207 domain-containing protein [Dokdonella sp.]|uniref:DUF2207 domain-containing protein n=1 Tax=Dokdonella sp. TaxID=2291710 RepID=UPI002D7F9C34|nr:DUF2207 domain-containing protein [Dokdonella sp.]HET9034129.1 DUF2207 domain-containing protein [Dokdonella sp.]